MLSLKLGSYFSLFFFFAFVQASPLHRPVKFEKKEILLGKATLMVEIADTPQKRQRGLMYRRSLPKGQGMLFIFKGESHLSFWMKNTRIPLDVGYFDRHQKLVDIKQMEPPLPMDSSEQLPSYRSKSPASFALEVNRDWFKKHKIKIGDQFKWAKAVQPRPESS